MGKGTDRHKRRQGCPQEIHHEPFNLILLAALVNRSFNMCPETRSHENGDENYKKTTVAIDLAFYSDPPQIDRAMKLFAEAGEQGRIDAWYYIGKIYEREGNYIDAEKYYLKGNEVGHSTAIFSLAMLHRRKKVPNPDREFYLRAIGPLSESGHLPSKVLYEFERLRGSYGLASVPIGLAMYLPAVVLLLFRSAKNKDDVDLMV